MDQLALSPFAPGDQVMWWDDHGRRVGRFVGIVTRGRHRGQAEVAVGGTISAERVVRVPPGRLTALVSRPEPDRGTSST